MVSSSVKNDSMFLGTRNSVMISFVLIMIQPSQVTQDKKELENSSHKTTFGHKSQETLIVMWQDARNVKGQNQSDRNPRAYFTHMMSLQSHGKSSRQTS